MTNEDDEIERQDFWEAAMNEVSWFIKYFVLGVCAIIGVAIAGYAMKELFYG